MDLTGSGPAYPALPGAARFRRLAAGRTLTSAERDSYGAAVLDGIRALQRAELAGNLEPASRPRCASGTAHTDGADILAALRRSQAASLASARAPTRTDAQIAAAYAEAMAEKRAEAARLAALVSTETPVLSLKPARLSLARGNRVRKSVRSVNRIRSPKVQENGTSPAYSLPRIIGAVGVSFGYGG